MKRKKSPTVSKEIAGCQTWADVHFEVELPQRVIYEFLDVLLFHHYSITISRSFYTFFLPFLPIYGFIFKKTHKAFAYYIGFRIPLKFDAFLKNRY